MAGRIAGTALKTEDLAAVAAAASELSFTY
jgi:hypothetical protein